MVELSSSPSREDEPAFSTPQGRVRLLPSAPAPEPRLEVAEASPSPPDLPPSLRPRRENGSAASWCRRSPGALN